jgi:hypothetical protein
MYRPYLKYYLLFGLIWYAAFSAAHAAADPLNQQLRLLIPGESAAHQSARDYTQSEIEQLVANLRADRITRKSTKKQIQRIADYVERELLRDRTDYAPLQDLFRNGTFTQASVTALYALIFEQLGIPFEIRVDLWEVYLVADPTRRAVALFAPGKRRRTAKREQSFIEAYNQFVAALYPNDHGEPTAGSFEARFHRNYFAPGATLDIRQLSAFMRYREGLHQYGQRAYAAALYALEAALRLDDRVAYRLLRRAALIQLADQNSSHSREALFYLFQLWQESPRDGHLRDEFVRRFIEGAKQLETEEDLIPFDRLYGYLHRKMISDPVLLRQLSEIYLLQKARFFARRGQVDQVAVYVDSLYRIKPNDPTIQDAVGRIVAWSLRGKREYTDGLNQLSDFKRRYPFLATHPAFTDMQLFYQAEHVRALYDREQTSLGNNALQQFDTMLAQAGGQTARSDLWTVTAYLAASNHFFRMGEYTTARQLLEKADRLVPGNHYLLHRIELLRTGYEPLMPATDGVLLGRE